MTQIGWVVLRSNEQFQGVPVHSANQIAEDSNSYAVTSDELNEYSPELFEQLRATRKELSETEQVPSYVVFHDRTLKEMAARLPQSIESFTGIHGVGIAKIQKYADVFLPIIRAHCQEHGVADEKQ